MKLLTVSSLPARDQGGVELLVQDLARLFAEAGIDSLIATNGESPLTVDDRRFVVKMSPIETVHGIPRLKTLISIARSFCSVHALLKKTRPDIVHVHFIDYALLYWTVLRPWFGFKLVVTGHGAEVTALLRGDRRSLPARLFPKLISFADRRTATAPQVAVSLAQVCRSKVITIENGIDLGFWDMQITVAKTPHLVSVGRLSFEKGHDILLRALSLMAPRHPQLKCTIVGDGPERVALGRLSHELGIEGIVSFTGTLGRDAIRGHLARASIFVLPSRDEGLPIALLEAMAAGLPVIATLVGGIPSVLVNEHSALLIPPADPGVLSGAIQTLLERGDHGRSMGENAKKRVADYALSKTVAAYQELYAEMLL